MRSATEYFWRTLSCLEMWSDMVLRVWYITSKCFWQWKSRQSLAPLTLVAFGWAHAANLFLWLAFVMQTRIYLQAIWWPKRHKWIRNQCKSILKRETLIIAFEPDWPVCMSECLSKCFFLENKTQKFLTSCIMICFKQNLSPLCFHLFYWL